MSPGQRAPAGLSPRAQRLWRDVHGTWKIDNAAVALLETALRALTRCEAAEKVVDADGLTVTDRFDQVRAHPLLVVIKEERLAFARIMRQLGLEDQ